MKPQTVNSERFAFIGLRLITYSIVFVIGYIVFDIVLKGAPTLSAGFFLEMPRASGHEGGIFPAIIGTAALVTGTISVALPLGIASAIYLSEYAHRGWLTRTIRTSIITLAGVPSIVFGLFGLGIFVYFFGLRVSIVSGSLTLACMILPTIIVASEEALIAVPRSFREASLALGATRWQTIRTNVLPYAVPGMMTGSILGIGRAAGETAPILFTAAVAFKPRVPSSIFQDVMALPYHLYYLATQVHDKDAVLPYTYATALVLLALVLTISLFAIVLRTHFRKRYKW